MDMVDVIVRIILSAEVYGCAILFLWTGCGQIVKNRLAGWVHKMSGWQKNDPREYGLIMVFVGILFALLATSIAIDDYDWAVALAYILTMGVLLIAFGGFAIIKKRVFGMKKPSAKEESSRKIALFGVFSILLGLAVVFLVLSPEVYSGIPRTIMFLCVLAVIFLGNNISR